MYGKNLEYGEVSIHVKGQSKSDQIVIIQSEDFNGLVVAHAYIRAAHPPGTPRLGPPHGYHHTGLRRWRQLLKQPFLR